jgi:ribulose-5-phosphate 4-epimerase/fuculose-1-phosphate aldolase
MDKIELDNDRISLFTGETESVRSMVSDAEWAMRVDLAAAYRLADRFGWTDLIFTHFSARVPGEDGHFLINPYGWAFDEITASSLVKIDVDGNKVGHSPHPVNPAGFPIHAAVHRAGDENHVVFHLHTPDGISVASQKQGLLPLSQHALVVIGDLAYHSFGGAGFQGDEGARIAGSLGGKHCGLLRNHGTMTVGKTVAAAFMRIYYLERACTIQVRMQGGGELEFPEAEAAAKLSEVSMRGMDRGADLVWPAMLRKLDRAGCDYAR